MTLTVRSPGWDRPVDVPCPACDATPMEGTGRQRWTDPHAQPGERETFDAWPATCGTCGHQCRVTEAVAHLNERRSWQDATLIICHDPGDTIDTTTTTRPAPTPGVRHDNPPTSRQAAALPREGRRRQCAEALARLGQATAAEIALWINTKTSHKPTTTNDVARRLRELADDGHTVEAGTKRNETTEATATVWRLNNPSLFGQEAA